MSELPANITVDKPKSPKGWAYVVKTSELITALELAKSEAKFNIFYYNSPPVKYGLSKKDLMKSFDILSLTWYGQLARNNSSVPYEWPFFHVSVSVCKPEYRRKLLPVLQAEFFPVIKRWIENIQVKPSSHALQLRYRAYAYPGLRSVSPAALVLTENGENELQKVEFDLDKVYED